MLKIELRKFIGLFIIFGLLFMVLEVIARAVSNINASLIGWTSIWMLPIGGICGVLLGKMNEIKSINKIPLLFQTLIGVLIVDIIELSTGSILNILFKLGIWNYSHEWLNLFGQISVPHTLGWCTLVPFVFWMDDFLRFFFYHEDSLYSPLIVYKRLITDFIKSN